MAVDAPYSQVHDAILGKLPEKIINYIGENDNSGQYTLFSHVKKNLEKILWSDLDFDNYVEAMTMDWSSNEHLEKLTRFKYDAKYKLLNEEEKAIWDKAIQRVYGNIDWLTNNAKPILDWIKGHE
ncbi:hypothetical protein OESDEN_14493 [Oesophagostomum dentatum]|uniref:Uncharacterized protein n=1 Tax=Oesophagostomum dentatum TaxID=61180 RepID=A0A0B1SPF8_OESDE|nr:hypothetical protein OESDEN_14493 [Oesophagostomum dentatum]